MSDPKTRPLTKREERRYSRKVCHEESAFRGWSCNRMFRGFCWRCMVRDLTGQTKRRRREYVAAMTQIRGGAK